MRFKKKLVARLRLLKGEQLAVLKKQVDLKTLQKLIHDPTHPWKIWSLEGTNSRVENFTEIGVNNMKLHIVG